MKISRTIFILFALTIFISATSSVALAIDTMETAILANQDDLQWGNAPPSLPAGLKVSVLLSDPNKPGAFVLRFKTDGEYRIPPHFHSRAETLTVISGTLYLGSGKEFDPSSAHALTVGGFHYLPAKTPHFAFTRTPTIVEVHGEGPFDIFYFNREDDPQMGRNTQ